MHAVVSDILSQLFLSFIDIFILLYDDEKCKSTITLMCIKNLNK